MYVSTGCFLRFTLFDVQLLYCADKQSVLVGQYAGDWKTVKIEMWVLVLQYQLIPTFHC